MRRVPHFLHMGFGFAANLVVAGCSLSAPNPVLHRKSSPGGDIQYTLFSPDRPATQRVIVAHGFLRSPQTMDHLATALASAGIETACIQLKRSRPWAGHHAENAGDMIALRQALGWKNVAYAGFSAGGLAALVAASEDKACTRLVLLDPVDQGTLGKDAAAKIHIPTLAILGRPGPGNANRNANPILELIRDCRIVEIPLATHCDFEAQPSSLCHHMTGSKPDAARTAAVHKTLLHEASDFLRVQKGIKP